MARVSSKNDTLQLNRMQNVDHTSVKCDFLKNDFDMSDRILSVRWAALFSEEPGSEPAAKRIAV